MRLRSGRLERGRRQCDAVGVQEAGGRRPWLQRCAPALRPPCSTHRSQQSEGRQQQRGGSSNEAAAARVDAAGRWDAGERAHRTCQAARPGRGPFVPSDCWALLLPRRPEPRPSPGCAVAPTRSTHRNHGTTPASGRPIPQTRRDSRLDPLRLAASRHTGHKTRCMLTAAFRPAFRRRRAWRGARRRQHARAHHALECRPTWAPSRLPCSRTYSTPTRCGGRGDPAARCSWNKRGACRPPSWRAEPAQLAPRHPCVAHRPPSGAPATHPSSGASPAGRRSPARTHKLARPHPPPRLRTA